jgi:predicted glycogen debranching enzyme
MQWWGLTRSWTAAKGYFEMTKFGPDVFDNLELALTREWIETNGLGGFASSTITGVNTRRYHGLLTAAMRPPVGRVVLLSKLEETLVVGDRRVDLSANEYPGAIHPQGYRYLKEFRLDPFPIFTYEVEGITIRKSVFMVDGENTTVVEYEVIAPRVRQNKLRLEVRPLVAFRDYHSTTKENNALQPSLLIRHDLVTFTPYADQPSLYLDYNTGEVDTTAGWYRNFTYRVERERGLDHQEDLYNPFAVVADLNEQSHVSFIASTTPHREDKANEYRQAEIDRRNALRDSAPSQSTFVRDLVNAADQYIVARGDQHTIIAGYPWFSDWGRDTMISLPGLTLATGRYEIARSILDAFSQHIDQGMLPNRFPDAGEAPEYNTVDATLWYFEAIRAWLGCTGDHAHVRDHWYGLLKDIIEWHEKGTRHGIRLEEDGLLHSGEPGVQLTWMDAKVGDWVVTPRQGKPVEIQALWYNAVRIMEELASRFGDRAAERRFSELADRARTSFNQQFWNAAEGCLYDVVDDGVPDSSVRPNQILAVSLPHSLLERERARQVVNVVQRELLTPLGLRTLAPSDPRYISRYEGDPRSRDAAYHQGTVWPWLMGPFVTAFLKVNDFDNDARRQAEQWLTPFESHLSEVGLGHISEIFDADAPHTPRGCFAQAWSVAELLRAVILVSESGTLTRSSLVDMLAS